MTETGRFAVHAGRTIDGLSDEPLTEVVVVVENERIAAIETASVLPALRRDNVEIVEAGNTTLLPGLIDGHVHLNFSGSVDPLRDYLADSDEELLLRAVTNAQTALRAGITTLRDCGSKDDIVLKLRDAINEGLVEGPRLLVAGMPITTTAGHCHFFGLEADSEDQVADACTHLLDSNVDLLKVMATGGNMTPGSNSRLAQYQLPHLRIIAERAHGKGKRVAAHVHTTPSIGDCIEAGIDTLEHCSWQTDLSEQETHVDYREDLVDAIIARGIHVCPAMGRNYTMSPEEGAPIPEQVEFWRNFVELRFRTLRAMFARGVPMFAGTDAGVKLTTFDALPDIMELMQREMGMSNMDVIRSATSIAAEAIGIAGETGAIEVGRRADLLIVDGDPSSNLAALRQVRAVFRDGRRPVLTKGSRWTEAAE